MRALEVIRESSKDDRMRVSKVTRRETLFKSHSPYPRSPTPSASRQHVSARQCTSKASCRAFRVRGCMRRQQLREGRIRHSFSQKDRKGRSLRQEKRGMLHTLREANLQKLEPFAGVGIAD